MQGMNLYKYIYLYVGIDIYIYMYICIYNVVTIIYCVCILTGMGWKNITNQRQTGALMTKMMN